MKSYKNIIISLLISLFSVGLAGQQTRIATTGGEGAKPKRELTENERKYIAAQRFLNGINTEVNHQKALALFADLAKQGDAKALNALGGMCRQGFGMPAPQPERARELFHRAARMGNAKAAYNLALMWKTGQGGEQDFGEALRCAEMSLSMGNERALYMLGYLHYKGLGTKQSYAKAVEYFTRGTELKQASSTYFLGLCYMGGYGVEKDIAKGKQLIEQAAALGNDHAVEFIVDGRNEKYEQPTGYQPEYRTVLGSSAPETLQGSWQGKILRYDYGRQQVVEERPLMLQIEPDANSCLAGLWVQSDSVVMTLQAGCKNGWYDLENMQYLQNWDRTWMLQTLTLEAQVTAAGDTVLCGNLVQFSPQTLEHSSPLVVELRRVKKEVEKEVEKVEGVEQVDGFMPGTLNTIKVYPNPFERDIELHIILQQAQQALVQVFDLSGKPVYSETCHLMRGAQSRRIPLETLPAGAYVVSVKSEAVNLQTLVIRKP